jgi:GAF domain-containing protein
MVARMTNETENRIPLDDLLVFHRLARSLTESFDLDTILRTILEHMERFIDAELWTLLMLDPATQELYYALAAGGEEAAGRRSSCLKPSTIPACTQRTQNGCARCGR